jgi:branched-subunit amino acid permease
VGVFIFLIISILFFSLIVGTVLKAKQSESKMRTGEKVLFASIILGILIAIIFGAMQMLSGVLF